MAALQVATNYGMYGQAFWDYCGRSKKKVKRKIPKIVCPEAKRPKNMDTLCKIFVTTAQDCCVCIKVLFYYFSEICRMVTCLQHGKRPTTNFSNLFCQLGDVTIRLFKDVYTLAKFAYRHVRKFYHKIEKCL
ncbi:uncharacterized protein LOC126379011 isoform X2 [Pectinophora gossypiella]|uniref:uncharacterized protein LOC126379011 isoform X2 n=1 Tax=Pectinophora gossypiella TaxID=13191 RepID=UPI00214DF275|nr:uncharacterized protein LOC126379011 isoform X2 [Pectinophora gossypiella]